MGKKQKSHKRAVSPKERVVDGQGVERREEVVDHDADAAVDGLQPPRGRRLDDVAHARDDETERQEPEVLEERQADDTDGEKHPLVGADASVVLFLQDTFRHIADGDREEGHADAGEDLERQRLLHGPQREQDAGQGAEGAGRGGRGKADAEPGGDKHGKFLVEVRSGEDGHVVLLAHRYLAAAAASWLRSLLWRVTCPWMGRSFIRSAA